jgi:hypothetical protein
MRSRLAIGGLVLAMLTACQSGGQAPAAHVTGAASPSTGCPASQQAPRFAPSTATTRSLVLASYAKGNDFVLRDITDIDHPATLHNFNRRINETARFVNATDLSLVEGGLARLTVDPAYAGENPAVVSGCDVETFAWSPDGTQAAYLEKLPGSESERLRLIGNGVDAVIGTVPAPGSSSECTSRECVDSTDNRLLFSPDGAYISLVRSGPAPVLRIWATSGKELKSVDGSSATMSVWSGDALYYQDATGIVMWRNGVDRVIEPNGRWVRPHASAAGGLIVFERREALIGTARVMMLDTKTGEYRLLADNIADRSEPVFLTPRYLWYRGERPCAKSDTPCIGTTAFTGLTYIYDLQTNQEFRSIITDVWDVWPHPA